mgnify:FL=1
MKATIGLPRPAKPGELVSLDCEMFGMQKPHRADGTFAALSVAYPTGELFVITDQNDIREALKRVSAGRWVFHNALFDLRILRRYASVRQRQVLDTMICEQDLFGGWYNRFDLANAARRWLGEQLSKGVREQFISTQTLTPEMIEYAASDAWATVRIAQKQLDYIEEEEDGKFNWYYDIDEPMIWVALDMPGIRVDVGAWRKQNVLHEAKARAIEKELELNVMSRDQVVSLLHELGLRGFKKTDAGNDSAGKVFLQQSMERAQVSGEKRLAEALNMILTARMYRKAVSTYGDTWLDANVEEDGRVYPSWKITGAETGRMACSDPNLQQIPARDLPIYRSFFLASPGHRLLIGDVNQQEPRFSAWMSGDKTLQQEILDGIDLHMVAADLFHIKGANRRRKGKDINLGLNYGMSAMGLAARVGISLEEAEMGLRERQMHYRFMHAWQDRMQRQAERLYKVRTASGRPVWVNPYEIHGGWRRNAINGPIQGSAADQTKMAAVLYAKEYKAPLLIVHDEMADNVPSGEMRKARRTMNDAWIEAGRHLIADMPVEVSMASGSNWGAKES